VKRFEVSGPYQRRDKPRYWVVFDTFKKHVVSEHPRKGDAHQEADELELEHRDKKVEDVK
jgi:hypothetical protein